MHIDQLIIYNRCTYSNQIWRRIHTLIVFQYDLLQAGSMLFQSGREQAQINAGKTNSDMEAPEGTRILGIIIRP